METSWHYRLEGNRRRQLVRAWTLPVVHISLLSGIDSPHSGVLDVAFEVRYDDSSLPCNHVYSAGVPAILLSSYATAQSKSNKYACSEPNPAQLCDASNTCGSASAPCVVDVKRTANGASSTPER
jgi:hypothetical protein